MTQYAYDPELVDLVDILPAVDLSDVTAIRPVVEQMDAAGAAAVDLGSARHEQVSFSRRSASGPDVVVDVYRPEASDGPDACVLLLHEGGFVVGTAASQRRRAVQLVEELGVIAVAVEYRLAPEHPYPAAFDDVWEALLWARTQADVDSARVAVIGESAGGALAAGLAQRARDEGVPLAAQGLIVPVLDNRLETRSAERFTDTPVWDRSMAETSWQHYLGDLSAAPPRYAVPAREQQLAGLPCAYISCMEFDPLRDEALEYAVRLLAAGVSVDIRCYAGAFHGATTHQLTDLARKAEADMVDSMARALRCGRYAKC